LFSRPSAAASSSPSRVPRLVAGQQLGRRTPFRVDPPNTVVCRRCVGFLDGQGRGKQRGGWVESGIPKHSPAVGFGTAPEPARQCSFRITPYEVGESTSNSVLRVSDKKNRQEYSAWSDKCAQTCHAGSNSPAPSNIRKIPRGGEVLLPRIPMRNYRALTFPISPLGISMSTSSVDTDLPRSILI